MRLRNGKHGYGAVTKTLHWLTLGLLVAQFAVGYRMDPDGDVPDAECDPVEDERGGGDTSAADDERLERLEERCEARQERLEAAAEDAVGNAWASLADGDLLTTASFPPKLPELHVLLGLAVLFMGVLRVTWRGGTPLPPWSPRLTAADRVALHWVERALLALLFLVPLSGLWLVAGAGPVGLHVAAHLCFYAAVAVHVSIVLRRRVVSRMLPGGGG